MMLVIKRRVTDKCEKLIVKLYIRIKSNTITHLTPEEINLILAAIKYDNAIQDRTDDEETEWIEEIEEEIPGWCKRHNHCAF